MKVTLLVIAVMLAGTVTLAAWRGGWPLVLDGLRRGGTESLVLLPLLLAVFVLSGLVQVLLPRELVASWLSADAGWRGYGIAWVAGVLTPGGGPIGLPLAAALLRAGASVGVVVTYVTSLSLLSFVRVPLELGLYGGRVTLLRLLASIALPPLAGVVAQTLAPLFVRS